MYTRAPAQPENAKQLADRPARDARVRRAPIAGRPAQCAGGVAARPRRSTVATTASRDRHDDPRESPADLADDADERHPDDPGERRPEQREREDARTLSGRRPLRHRRDRGRVRDADPHSDERLSDDEHCECRSCGAQRASRRRGPRRRREGAPAGRRRAARRPVARAATPAASPETVRSWPAVAIETSRSRATSGSSGLSTTSAACDAASAASSVEPDDARRVLHQMMIGTVPPSALHAAPVT